MNPALKKYYIIFKSLQNRRILKKNRTVDFSYLRNNFVLYPYSITPLFIIFFSSLGRVSLEYELTTFASDNFHVNIDMAVVCILSHGENGHIICR